jgi:hypothetical protein
VYEFIYRRRKTRSARKEHVTRINQLHIRSKVLSQKPYIYIYCTMPSTVPTGLSVICIHPSTILSLAGSLLTFCPPR